MPVSALHQHLKGVCRPTAHPARAVAGHARLDPRAVTAAGSHGTDQPVQMWVGEGQ
ncbi:hypothetical protein GCM10027280_38830 [Micromonospora polyrhachis]|uniref:Uncharacterized protein n=1 Tax=Micromonospora polyrhachis TaxID=1282883 RepID=A0A7W7SRN6_9ACTN|nr:hypothetical protein [Micromonospora polyrhachis]